MVRATTKVSVAPTARQITVFAKERNFVSFKPTSISFKDNIAGLLLVTLIYAKYEENMPVFRKTRGVWGLAAFDEIDRKRLNV